MMMLIIILLFVFVFVLSIFLCFAQPKHEPIKPRIYKYIPYKSRKLDSRDLEIEKLLKDAIDKKNLHDWNTQTNVQEKYRTQKEKIIEELIAYMNGCACCHNRPKAKRHVQDLRKQLKQIIDVEKRTVKCKLSEVKF